MNGTRAHGQSCAYATQPPSGVGQGATTIRYEDEYELFLNHVNGLIERRKSVTTTYLSVNAAISAAIAFLFKDDPLQGWAQQISILVLLTTGLIACTLWRRLIGQYTTMIGWWYGRLRALENSIPDSSKSVTQEYCELYLNGDKKVARGLSTYEVRLVWLFTFVYSVFGAGTAIVLVSNLA